MSLFMKTSAIILLAACAVPLHAAPPSGQWVVPAADGRLLHARDALGNRIVDAGSCGFMNGVDPIPNVPVVVVLSPPAGDATSLIQGAINLVAARGPDASGMRGAILLTAGEYAVGGTLNINRSGIVLRGVGTSESAGTRLRATASWQHTLVNFSGTGSRSVVPGTTRDVSEKYVPVGARSLTVTDASIYQVGDSVEIYRPSTAGWIQSLGMNLLDSPWQAGDFDLRMERTVTRVEGNRIFLDAPVTTALDAAYGGGQVRKHVWSGERLRMCGIEGIAGISSYDSSLKSGGDFIDENHGWNFIQFQRAEDCWARDVSSRYFGYSCVNVNTHCRRISVLNAASRNPVSQVIGGRRYAFNLDDSTLCLFRGCTTGDDRHHFVTGSLATGPSAFVAGTATSARADAGPHHRWGNGILFDRITVEGNKVNIQNRGNEGTGQGWAGANCTVWNSVANAFIVRNPPGARNWLVGSIGGIESGNQYVGPNPAGTYDSSGTTGVKVFPASLHANQRRDLIERAGLQVREYVAGDRDNFTVDSGEITPVNPAWAAQAAGLGPVAGFDDLTSGRIRAWSHGFTLDGGEQIASATLWLSVRGLSANAPASRLYVNTTAASQPLSDFAAAIPTGSATVLRVDLAGRLSELASGALHLAVGPEVAVDWSELELRVAPFQNRPLLSLVAEADGMVRGGDPYATQVQDGGTGTGLSVKGVDLRADVLRRAMFRWDLSGDIGKVVHAEIRLNPLSTSNDTVEHALSVLGSGNWQETTLTWNNQPASDPPLFSWHAVAGRPVSVVVTREVREAISSTGKLSVMISAAADHTNNDSATYASREHADAALRPTLFIRTGSPLENWRYRYFGTESPVADASDYADPDGDGADNLAEFGAGSIPACAASTPETAASLKLVVVATSTGIDEYAVQNQEWVFSRRIMAINGGVHGLTAHQGAVFATTLDTPRRILRVDPLSGAATVLAVRNTGAAAAAGWIDSDPQGIEAGPDGMLYFSTAFGTSGGEGVFRLNPDGGGFSRFIARSGVNWDLYNARDLEWHAGQLYVSARGGYNASSRPVYRFSAAGAYQATLTEGLIGPQGLEMEQDGLLVTGSATGPAALCMLDPAGPFPVPISTRSVADIVAGMDALDLHGDTFLVTYNTGTGGMGQIVRRHSDGTASIVVPSLNGSGNDLAPLSVVSKYDMWAAGHGLDPGSPSGGREGDADGDGTANWIEFALGLDPRDGASRFAITMSGNTSSGLTLTWPSLPGLVFEVRSGDTPASFPVLEAVVPAESAPSVVTSWSSGPLVAGKRFYRVEFRTNP